MRKIISILVTLGVILGLTLAAAPVAAAPCVCPTTMATVDVLTPPFCAGLASNYLIGSVSGIKLPVTLTAGTDSLSVDFPAGTDLSSVVFGGVFIDFAALDNAASLVISGTHLEARIPVSLIGTMNAATTAHRIQVNGVVNTAAADVHCLYVDYKLACCAPVQFACGTFTVVPALATMDFVFDFGDTYDGVAEGFIPPFKACGQEAFGHEEVGIGYVTDFDIILRDVVPGCNPPCVTPSAFWFEVTKCPVGETITLDITGAVGTPFTLDATDITTPATKYALPWAGWPPGDVVFPAWIHFSSPGDYELCFYVQCPEVPCKQGPQIVAEECLPAKVYQWKDAGIIELDEKWNLVSLPLVPFDTSIANLLKSLPAEALDMDKVDDLVSIHHYDRTGCADPGTWNVYGNGQTSLSTMEDGKSYWVRMTYPNLVVSPIYKWWVWGTALPMPPASPKEYPACTGWNMLGFTWLDPLLVDLGDPVTDYLWNWALGSYVVYGWDNTGDWTTSTWDYIDPTGPDDLLSGQGYWAAFKAPGGLVYVPGP